MAPAVAREESDLDAVDVAENVGVRGVAERRVDHALARDVEPLHLVQAGAADDADRALAHRLNFLIDSSMAAATRIARSTAARPSSPATIGRERSRTQPRNASSSARSGSFFSTLISSGRMLRSTSL